MLSWIRDRSNSLLVKFIFGGVAVSFVVGFGISSQMIAGQSVTGPQAAKVYDEVIPLGRYQRQVSNLAQTRSRLGDINPTEIRQEALDSLVQQAVLIHEAKEIGMRVTDQTLQRSIQKTLSFLNQATGDFDKRLYDELYASNSAKVNYEAGSRNSILLQRITGLLQSLAQVSPAEIEDEYRRNSATMRLGLIKLTPSEMAIEVQPTEEALRKYFDEHQDDFRIPEQRRVEFISVNTNEMVENPEIADSEIQKYYYDHLVEYSTSEEMKASHILLKVEEGADEATSLKQRDRIMEILEKAKAGEDFAELAKTHSEGPTGPKGGDLGFFDRGKMVKSFEDASFAANIGEVVGPIKTKFGWHIMKATERRQAGTKPLEQVSDDIRSILAEGAKDGLKEKLLDELAAEIAGSSQPDLETIAGKRDYATYATSDLFGKKVLALANVEAALIYSFREKAFAAEKGKLSDRFGNDLIQYYLMPTEIQPERMPPYAEVSDKVNEEVELVLRAEEAEKIAEKWLVEWKEGENLAETKKDATGVTYIITDAFPVGGFIVPELGYDATFNEERYNLTEASPFLSKPVRQGDRAIFLAKMVERLAPDPSGLEAEKGNILRRLMSRKSIVMASVFMDEAVKKANEDGAVRQFVKVEE